jgi:hypothetical protein
MGLISERLVNGDSKEPLFTKLYYFCFVGGADRGARVRPGVSEQALKSLARKCCEAGRPGPSKRLLKDAVR